MAVGEDNEHLIYPQLYCSCQDFYKNVVIKRERPFCKHILAQVIAEELNTFEQIEVPDEEFKYMIKDLEVKFPHS
jgi:predicted nucleic acid-binding Zn finger protein